MQNQSSFGLQLAGLPPDRPSAGSCAPQAKADLPLEGSGLGSNKHNMQHLPNNRNLQQQYSAALAPAMAAAPLPSAAAAAVP
jgi:hypothetical protein